MDGFKVAGGSVPGWEHTQPGKPGWKNNQDAFHFVNEDHLLVAVVCDGCGSSPYSEVGARIGSRLAVNALRLFYRPDAPLRLGDDFVRRAASLREEMLIGLCRISREMVLPSDKDSPLVLAEHFLFTIVGIAMDRDTTYVFSIGDGVWAVNGDTHIIPASEGNMPPYIAYGLLPGTMEERLLRFVVHARIPTREVRSLAIGTDGVADLIAAARAPLPVLGTPVGPLSQFWEDPKYVENPDAIRRRLAMVNREWAEGSRIHHGLLRDDTTLVVVRREPEQEER